MKFLTFATLLLLIIACTPKNSDQKKSNSNSDCKNFKNGNFHIIDMETGELITNIIRLDELQRETTADGTSLETTVYWTDYCTYELRVCKVINNPSNIPISKTETLVCTIGEISGDTCKLISVLKGSSDYLQYYMVRKR